MIATAREVFERRDLLYVLAWREIKVKYKQSIMGFMWAIFVPATIVAAGILVRLAFAIIGGRALGLQEVASVTVRSIPWAFVVSAIHFSTSSLIGNRSLITKIYLPREVFPVASILAQLVDFAVASSVLAVVLAVARVGIGIEILWVPLLVLILILQVTGLGILLSAASLFFRDVKYLVEVILTFAIFFTPVFFEVEMFGKWATLLMLNPVAPVLEGFAACLVEHQAPPLPWLAYSAGVGVVVLLVAMKVFDRIEPYFAESI